MTHPAEPVPADRPTWPVNDGVDAASQPGGGAALEPWLREIVRCPRCKGELADTDARDALTCSVCALSYPIENGVPVLLVELAHPLGA